MIRFDQYQEDAMNKLKNGSILCGGVGSGKSITALLYYLFCVCEGSIKINGNGSYSEMKKPRDLYIITTAKKRDSLEWQKECSDIPITITRENSHSGVQLIVDSWNNIKKYKNIVGAFFIFDEQRVVGSGAWVKAFIDISRKNQWILLSATPGDEYKDYIPVFVANGFYKNKTEFTKKHCIYSAYSKFPKIERYINTAELIRHQKEILVHMDYKNPTHRNEIPVICSYNVQDYRKVFKDRWNIFDNEPIEETGKLLYLTRRVVNSDLSRIEKLDEILLKHRKVIIFYNFNYELNMIKELLDSIFFPHYEWNGNRHDELPDEEQWAYLVQYASGCEGWNCISTDTMIFFSQNYSYRVKEQAMGRIDRRNTPFKELYYYEFRSRSPIDNAIHQKLKNKQNFNESSFLNAK